MHRTASVIGLGTWQLGADWGRVNETEARAILDAATGEGITFVDTADVYGDGRSERIIGSFLADEPGRAERLLVATKMGRRAPQDPAEFTQANFRSWLDRSRANLGVDTIDLVQLHCPPSAVFADDRVFDDLDALVDEGVIAHYGVSVETCDEALTAIARPGVASVQIILNPFRLKPLEQVVPAAADAGVAVIARVPLASGLLSGKFGPDSTFAADDHRSFNRDGSAFDVGETFSGVDYTTGLAAVGELSPLVPAGMTMAQLALRWIIQQPGVTTVIPGASSVDQAVANARAADAPPLERETLAAIAAIYDERIRPEVHHRW